MLTTSRQGKKNRHRSDGGATENVKEGKKSWYVHSSLFGPFRKIGKKIPDLFLPLGKEEIREGRTP